MVCVVFCSKYYLGNPKKKLEKYGTFDGTQDSFYIGIPMTNTTG